MGFVLLPEALGRRLSMARKSFKGGKDKRDGGAFVSVPLSVLNSRAYTEASPYARMLLFDLVDAH